HDRQQASARLSITVLARQRSAVRRDEMRRLVEKARPACDAVGRVQIEVDTAVHAALPEMPVERGRVAVAIEELLKISQIVADVLGADRRVLPSGIEVRIMRDL